MCGSLSKKSKYSETSLTRVLSGAIEDHFILLHHHHPPLSAFIYPSFSLVMNNFYPLASSVRIQKWFMKTDYTPASVYLPLDFLTNEPIPIVSNYHHR